MTTNFRGNGDISNNKYAQAYAQHTRLNPQTHGGHWYSDSQ